MMYRYHGAATALLVVTFTFTACSDNPDPTTLAPVMQPTAAASFVPSPAPLVPIAVPGGSQQIWPFTDGNLDRIPSDPINLIFLGEADPRNVRSALMAASGARAGPFAPFTCTWTDAVGQEQASYAAASGWTGSVIQLECGDYRTVRFHLRLFRVARGFTIANAHVDVIIPGTHEHEVLSWELAEQLVAYDLANSPYLVAAPSQTGQINPAPTFREIHPQIYNALPVELRALTEGPLFGTVTSGVGIATDGSATVLTLGPAPAAGGTSQALEITWGQTVPKPFCNSGLDFIRVDGPLSIRQQVRVSAGGTLTRQTTFEGQFVVRAVNPFTGAIGAPFDARVFDHAQAQMNDATHSLHRNGHQKLMTELAPQMVTQSMRVGHGGPTQYRSSEKCR
jgi:hypothetical protein